jgi:hypothetical protein
VAGAVPFEVAQAEAGLVVDVDALGVGVFAAFEPVYAFAQVGVPVVVHVAEAGQGVFVGVVAVGILRTVNPAELQILIPNEVTLAIARIHARIGPITIAIHLTVELTASLLLDPPILIHTYTGLIIEILSSTMLILSTIQEIHTLESRRIPRIILHTLTGIDIDIGSCALLILLAVEPAVLVMP